MRTPGNRPLHDCKPYRLGFSIVFYLFLQDRSLL